MSTTTVPTCQYCKCTDNDCRHCIERTGSPCYWVSAAVNVCSACSPWGRMRTGSWWAAECSAEDRKGALDGMSAEQLQRVLEWPDVQKSVLPKARRLLRERLKEQ